MLLESSLERISILFIFMVLPATTGPPQIRNKIKRLGNGKVEKTSNESEESP